MPGTYGIRIDPQALLDVRHDLLRHESALVSAPGDVLDHPPDTGSTTGQTAGVLVSVAATVADVAQASPASECSAPAPTPVGPTIPAVSPPASPTVDEGTVDPVPELRSELVGPTPGLESELLPPPATPPVSPTHCGTPEVTDELR